MNGGFLLDRWTTLWRWLRGMPQQEHEKQLMQLYWNRAELKKALAALQDEQAALIDKVKNHEGSVRRAEEQIVQLHAHLGNPTVAPHALTYFQLRALWKAASDRLTRFNLQLRREQEERESRRHFNEWEAVRTAQTEQLQTNLTDAQATAEALELRLIRLEQELAQLPALWHFFKRRKLLPKMAILRDEWQAAANRVTDLSDERVELASLPLPEFPGVSLEGCRIVNTATIAYAEFLMTRLPHRALVALAKQAMTLQVFDAFCGNSAECTRIMELVKASLTMYADLDRHLAALKEPTERIRGRALYRSTEDTIPLSDSIGYVAWDDPLPGGTLDRKLTKLNVLADDCWSIGQLLLK